jgi:hypothetical protein
MVCAIVSRLQVLHNRYALLTRNCHIIIKWTRVHSQLHPLSMLYSINAKIEVHAAMAGSNSAIHLHTDEVVFELWMRRGARSRLHSAISALCILPYLHSALCILHSLHSVFCTLHSAFCIMHSECSIISMWCNLLGKTPCAYSPEHMWLPLLVVASTTGVHYGGHC